MDTRQPKWRMYGLVPYNISDIQKGIQFGHAVVEYMQKFPIDLNIYSDTLQWARNDKTFIILNGGTTNDQKINDGIPHGTLNQHVDELMLRGIKHAIFREPDLQNAVTAVVFLVPEQVWDYEKYPPIDIKIQPPSDGISTAAVYIPETEEAYAKRLGGEQNVWLREFLSKFRLA